MLDVRAHPVEERRRKRQPDLFLPHFDPVEAGGGSGHRC